MTLYKSSTRKVPQQSLYRRFSAGFIGGGTTSAGEELIKSINKLPPVKEEDGESIVETPTTTESKKRVGLFALFRYSTRNEKWLMVVGIIMAGIAGLSMPIWLLLLAQSLEIFNQIGALIASGASYTILLDEMYKLIYSFAIVVGGVSLVSGTAYTLPCGHTLVNNRHYGFERSLLVLLSSRIWHGLI